MSWHFGDFQLLLGRLTDRDAPFKRLNELFAMTGQVGFLATQRLSTAELILTGSRSRRLPSRKRDQRKGLEWVVTLTGGQAAICGVDYEEDDTSDFSPCISTAKQLVMDVGRMDEDPHLLKTKMPCGQRCSTQLRYLYENRSNRRLITN